MGDAELRQIVRVPRIERLRFLKRHETFSRLFLRAQETTLPVMRFREAVIELGRFRELRERVRSVLCGLV